MASCTTAFGSLYWIAMNILYPKIASAQFPAMLGYAGAGAVLAGLYGIVHDEITY
jgi:hypothetical protein